MTAEQRDRRTAWIVVLGFFLVVGFALSQVRLTRPLNETFTKISTHLSSQAVQPGTDVIGIPAVTESLLDRVRRENDFRPAPREATGGANVSARPDVRATINDRSATVSNGSAGSFPVATFPEPTFSNTSPSRPGQPTIAMPAPAASPSNGKAPAQPSVTAEAMRERSAQMTRCFETARSTPVETSRDVIVRRHQDLTACLAAVR